MVYYFGEFKNALVGTMNMKRWLKYYFITACCIINLSSYGQHDLRERMEKLSDSIKAGDLVLYNAFKYQVLAHAEGGYDSVLIATKLYEPFPELWDSCMALIFGEEGKMYSKQGIVHWNKSLFNKQKRLLNKLDTLSKLNLDSLFIAHLRGLEQLTGFKAKGKWILYAGPDENYSIFMGGCSSKGMAIDLAHSRTTVEILTEAVPHELEHMIFEQSKRTDPDWNTALGATLDEGLACYYTYRYFNKRLPQSRVIENMTDAEFAWYVEHEKEIFEKSLPYLFKNAEERNPYQCNCRAGGCEKLYKEAPKTICYYLGFRIIETYTQKFGIDSWKDIYKMPLREFFEKSGYSEKE